MDNNNQAQAQMGEKCQRPLSPVIHSLQEEGYCPPEVIDRLKEFEDRADSMEDLPADLRLTVALVLERDDALKQNVKFQESEQELSNQLMKAQQEKESALALARESVEFGCALAEIASKYCEDWRSECYGNYTSGSEKASLLIGDEDSTDIPEESKTQMETMEKIGEFFRLKSIEMANETDETPAKNKKDSRQKPQEPVAEANGEELLNHFGEDDLSEPIGGGYKDLEELVNSLSQKSPVASDGVKVTWSRCKPEHMNAVVANVEDREVYYDIKGEPLPSGEYPPKTLELFGQTFILVGYNASTEIELIPVTAILMKHMYPTYKVLLKNVAAEDRPSAIVKIQELLGPDIYVDGAKKAEAIVSARKTKDSFLEMEEEPDEENDNAGRPQRKEPVKTSRRQQNKERSQLQADPGKEEEARKKEEQAQQKREKERQRHEQKKQEKAKRKAENPNYRPSQKRDKQRMETFVHPASHKKQCPLISGKSYWSPTLVAYVLFLSLSMMLPIYRIESASTALLGGLNIPLSTLEALSTLVFSRKLKHLLPYFHNVLNAQHYIHADETVIEVFREELRKNTTKSYIWIYSTIVSCPTQVRIYDYKPGRKGEFCKTVLASFVGVLITDAYQGYNMVDGVEHAFCFIHARRKIYDAAQNGSTRYARKLAKRVLILIDELFSIERGLQAAGYDPETLAKKRQEEMKHILPVLKDTLTRMQKDQRIPKNGKLAKAVNYMLGHYEALTYFLKDGNVPMHNQVSEHAARRVAIYRNASMFCGSPAGAEAFAGILSIAETARANNLDVYKYFVFLLENMRGDGFWKDEDLMKSLLPWSERAQAECAAKNPIKGRKIRLLGGQEAI